jgi:branched-chain amino acid transport system ATP-binding protein
LEKPVFLEVDKIDTYYDIFQAIFEVSLKLDEGEVVSLLGRNGAGKTTTMASIVGLNQPKSGSVKFKGQEISTKKPFQISRLGICFVPENRWIFSELTVRENLELGLRRGKGMKQEAGLKKVYELFPKLRTLENHLGGNLSGGEQQMLTIGRSLMGDPELLLLDEPTAGLAPIVVQMLGEKMNQLKEEGLTILFTEQNALFALDISDKAYVIDKGVIVYEGSVTALSQDKETMREYLGV